VGDDFGSKQQVVEPEAVLEDAPWAPPLAPPPPRHYLRTPPHFGHQDALDPQVAAGVAATAHPSCTWPPRVKTWPSAGEYSPIIFAHLSISEGASGY